MTVSVNVGDFRHRIEIQEGTVTKGAQGTQTETFAKVATVWGSIKETADEQFRVDIRYFTGLVPTARKVLDDDDVERPVNRLKHGARILNITDVLDVNAMKQIMRVICTRDPQTF